jgi:hypothetical protein
MMAWLVLASAVSLSPCEAASPDCQVSLNERQIGVRIRQPDLFAGSLESMLDSGLELRLVEQFDLVDDDGHVLGTGRCLVRAVYDLWNERYVVQASEDPLSRRAVAKKEDALEIIRQVNVLVPVGTRAGARVHLRVQATLAPAAAEADQTSKEWLSHARSSPGAAEDAGSSNLFVAFADLFGLPDPDETLRASYTIGPCAPESDATPTVRVNPGGAP